MSSHLLTPEARRENAATLASALGLSLEDASEALDLDIAITAEPTDRVAQQIAREVSELLSRTVRRISVAQGEGNIAAELVLGSAVPRTNSHKIYVGVRGDRAVISQSAHATEICAPIPGILGLLIACYASAAALYHALGGILPFGLPEPFVLPFDQLGIDLTSLAQPIDLGHAYMAGAGAIGNGFLWAARHLDLRGRLEIADDDCVSSGNLNRQIWFNADDIGLPKVARLSQKAQALLPRLVLVPRPCRLQDLPEKSASPWLHRLIVAVDSRRARRALQNECPREVFDASTTDIREVVLHHHIQPTAHACLSCIYEPDDEEFSREQHIAEHLGVSVDDVRSERLSAPVADIIAARFTGLAAADLVGTAYDTLFKRLCAESRLHTPAGRTVIAPFAFVSVLAGTLLALEIVRRLGKGNSARDFNYWRSSPWHPPLARRRTLRPRQPGCVFCGNALLRKVNESLWR
ncbi:MAG: ThiF family adenylyltransferase [Acidobacteriaceae bacterium]